MVKKITASFIGVLTILTAHGQQKPNQFKMIMANNSAYTTTCTIFGNDKTDTVHAGKTKSIVFTLAPDQFSFLLSISTSDHSTGSFRDKVIKILNTSGARQFTVTKESQLQYTPTSSERIIADYNPQPRSKNFWKLDTVIKNHADDIAAAEIIYVSLCDIDVPVDTIKTFFGILAPKIQSSVFGKRIENYLVARSRLNTGSKFENFALVNTNGKTVRLNDIHSDYVFLDFWFSRCAPCIKSFPEIKDLYAKTGRNELEIVSISVDQAGESDLWKSTISKHSLSWINVNDPKATLAAKYAIVNYPTKVLIDKNKKIVLVDTDNSYTDFYKQVEKLVNEK